MLVADPANVLAESNESNNEKSVPIPPPDIAVTDLQWNTTDGGVDFSYKIGGISLPQATTVAVYWASDTTFASHIGDPIYTTVTATAATTAATSMSRDRRWVTLRSVRNTSSRSPIPNRIAEADETNRHWRLVAYPASRSSPSTGMRTGTGARQFLAQGSRFRLQDRQLRSTGRYDHLLLLGEWCNLTERIGGSLATKTLSTIQGTHDRTTEPFESLNEPAKWGKPPAEASYVMAVIDPGDKIVKTAENVNQSIFLIQTLPLASEAEVLKGSVTSEIATDPNGLPTWMTATFEPGKSSADGPMEMSRAEVSLGVDHFNWLQQLITIPSGWEARTLVDYHSSNVVPPGTPRIAVVGEVPYPIIASDDRKTFHVDTGSPISSDVRDVPFPDPIALPAGVEFSDYYTRAYVIPSSGGGPGYAIQVFVDVPPDRYYTYFNENKDDLGSHLGSSLLTFNDRPKVPLFSDVFNTSDGVPPIINPFGDHGYFKFVTSLVGVGYDFNQLSSYGGKGYQVDFSWKSDTVWDGTKTVGGKAYDIVMWADSPASDDSPPAVAGGVYDCATR